MTKATKRTRKPAARQGAKKTDRSAAKGRDTKVAKGVAKKTAKPAATKRAAKTVKKTAKRAPAPKIRADQAGADQAVTAEAIDAQVQDLLAALKAMSTARDRENLARFGINARQAFGVSMVHIHLLARRVGRSHTLAAALWETGWYEARLLTAFVDEPARVTPAQMDRWCDDFDNWGICDTVCFKLFDQTPHAWAKVAAWHDRPEEFVRRAAFALIASLAGHDKRASDAQFLATLPFIEAAATDARNFVKKGVSWALRALGQRNAALHAAAMTVAQRLAAAPQASARWVGKDTLRDITRPLVMRRIAARAR